MKSIIAFSSALICVLSNCAIGDTVGSGANAFKIEFATIGNPSNAGDTTTGALIPVGAVPYEYRMGKYEISRSMFAKASAEGNLGLSMSPMQFVTGGTRPDMPATGVSWFEAARFVNWLNTSKGFPAAYKFNTQAGDTNYNPNEPNQLWQASDPGFDPENRFRNTLAYYFLPSAHEYHKAAYYDPNANDGTGIWWNYTNGSDDPPMMVASGTTPGTSVLGQQLADGPADITQAGGLTPYGVMAMGGNVQEWEETGYDFVNSGGGEYRGVRRGHWNNGAPRNALTDRGGDGFPPSAFDAHVGFRVASMAIPEVSSVLLITMGGLILIAARRRNRVSQGKSSATRFAKRNT